MNKNKIWKQVDAALKSGELQRMPCEVCGAEPAHAHHDDYDKPLTVRWLCPRHHGIHHSNEHGGKRPGSGRKALDPLGTIVTTIRLTGEQKAAFDMLGGKEWLRHQLQNIIENRAKP